VSKGLGQVQRAILDLIAREPEGAWTITDLCEVIYGDIGKSRRVSVGRALRKMTLPDGWNTARWGIHHCLYFEASLEGQIRKLWRMDYRDWTLKRVKANEWVREHAQKALDYVNATPLERLDLDIQRQQQFLVTIRMCGGPIPRDTVEYIMQLQEKRTALAEGSDE
jgi:hypothetical protein